MPKRHWRSQMVHDSGIASGTRFSRLDPNSPIWQFGFPVEGPTGLLWKRLAAERLGETSQFAGGRFVVITLFATLFLQFVTYALIECVGSF